MANTTNFGWETPDDTDLVKDGAAAIRTLGSAIDTSLVDLKGGTTGQVLSKTSNTDLDFTWTTITGDITEVTAGTGISGGGTSGAITITNSMATAIDAKGDLVAGTGADTFARLAVGTNGQVLIADSTAATGLAWSTLASCKLIQIVAATYSTNTSNSTTTYADTGLTATITPTSASNKILVFANQSGLQKSNGNAANEIEIKLLRGATQIAFWDGLFTNTTLQMNGFGGASWVILDTPATTSATTYKTQFRNGSATASVGVQYNSSTSSIVLIEVAV